MVLKVDAIGYGLSYFFAAAAVMAMDSAADVVLKAASVAVFGLSFCSAAVVMVVDSASAVVAAKIP